MFGAGTKVLIVDDMRTMRKLVQSSCKQLGMIDFIEAGDGNEAWRALEESEPPINLIISDWNMPNCTGLEFLKKLRASEKYKHLPFLMLTAESEAAQVTEAVQAGVDNYLVKPFKVDSLKDKLTLIYKRRFG